MPQKPVAENKTAVVEDRQDIFAQMLSNLYSSYLFISHLTMCFDDPRVDILDTFKAPDRYKKYKIDKGTTVRFGFDGFLFVL